MSLQRLEEEVKQWKQEGIEVEVLYDTYLRKTTAVVEYEGRKIYSFEYGGKKDKEESELSQKEYVLNVVLEKLKISGVFEYTLLNGEKHCILEENVYEALSWLVYYKKPLFHPSQITGIELKFVPIDGVPKK